jgi:GTP cyclohydrolase I
VVVRDLAVTTMCPHHLLPAHGTGLVAYVPGDRVAGIGTIAHVVDALSRRLTLQERIGADVTAILVRELGARGALCRLSLTHSCLTARGERKTGAVVETLAVAGTFAIPSPDRDLAFAALGGRFG